MDGFGCSVLTSMDDKEKSNLNKVVASVGDTSVLLADGIHKIVPERDSKNVAGTELPRVFSHLLIVSDMHTLVQDHNLHQIRLEQRFLEADIFNIYKAFAVLETVYHQNRTSTPFVMDIKVYSYHSKMHGV